MKKLFEKRNVYLKDLKEFADSTNAMDKKRVEELRKAIESIDAQIAAKRLLIAEEQKDYRRETTEKGTADAEEMRAFADYLRHGEAFENRGNWTVGDNGAVIPKNIADRIIDRVYELAPIVDMVTSFNSPGNLVLPVYDDTNEITVDYATEFTALSSTSASISSVTLGGYLFGALTKVSRSLVDNSNFDIAGFVVDKLAFSMSRFIHDEILAGDGEDGHFTGLLNCSNTVDISGNITADKIIDVSQSVPKAIQDKAIWLMNRQTLATLKKLKYATGEYILQADLTAPMGYSVLGTPVFIDEKMPNVAAGAKPIVYGDLSGVYLNRHKDISIQPLFEKYADEHAVGYVAWAEMDSKVVEPQKIAVVNMTA